MTKQTNPIYAAVEVYRAPALKRAAECAAEFAQSRYDNLAANDWHLEAVAPAPRSNEGRFSYQSKKAAQDGYQAVTSYDRERCDAAYHARKSPHEEHKTFLKRDEDRRLKFIAEAVSNADAVFDGYVAKLVGKCGAGVVKAEVDNGSIWTRSILTVEMADGSIQRWKTQCIINVSVLGKLFNQWPTRLIK